MTAYEIIREAIDTLRPISDSPREEITEPEVQLALQELNELIRSFS